MFFARTATHLNAPLRSHLISAFGLGGLFLNASRHAFSTSTATQSAYLLRNPHPTAPREAPTPLVFVSASRWDASSRIGMDRCAAWFAERGYTCLELDLAHPGDVLTSEALMKHYETEMASHIRPLAIPFAPVIVARAGGTLIAQTYISSYPASALLLISPPPSNAAVSPPSPRPLLPTSLQEFNFEPRFPCAVLCTEREQAALEKENRLWKDSASTRWSCVTRQQQPVRKGLSRSSSG